MGSGRGGRRDGAGPPRKDENKKTIAITIRFEPDLAAWLRTQRRYSRLVNLAVRSLMTQKKDSAEAEPQSETQDEISETREGDRETP